MRLFWTTNCFFTTADAQQATHVSGSSPGSSQYIIKTLAHCLIRRRKIGFWPCPQLCRLQIGTLQHSWRFHRQIFRVRSPRNLNELVAAHDPKADGSRKPKLNEQAGYLQSQNSPHKREASASLGPKLDASKTRLHTLLAWTT